ncbi:MAG: NADH-quinone oxidoreductase subunit L [Fidelibacterota bacterium]
MDSVIWLIPGFPLAGFLLNGLLGKRLSEKASGLIGSVSVGLSFVLGTILFGSVLNTHEPLRQSLFTWLWVGDLQISVSYLLDSVSLIMVLVVTGVGCLIHVYSMGYMKGDRGFQRYFAFLNLFTFMMLTLVMADNLVLLFVGWEGVGLCSYLLIGHWFEDREKAAAGKKAFIVNRVGDAGFLLAMFLIFSRFGSLEFSEILVPERIALLRPQIVTAMGLLLFLGAVGKSAQIPLYVWLPDAMAGPTPVSALIHAATMVTGGVYLIARLGVLFSASAVTVAVITIVGTVTAFLAATMAVTENDIKKVLAYSTISQLGTMITAVGMGAYAAGLFHLVTHAFFKATLFLGAGSVIHALGGHQDMRKMGDLKSSMPRTYLSMLAGVGAISGVPLLSGFFSKDEILWSLYAWQGTGRFLYLLGLATAVLTALYMFRLLFLTFHGQARWDRETAPRDARPVMTAPLITLALLAVFGGYVGLPEFLGLGNPFREFVHHSAPDGAGLVIALGRETLTPQWMVMMFSIVAAAAGIGLAFFLYQRRPDLPGKVAGRFTVLHTLVSRKYYVDEIYDVLFVQPVRRSSEWVWRAFDIRVVDGLVNGSGKFMGALSGRLRRVQTGVVQTYAVVFLAGVVLMIFYLFLR